MLDSRSYMIALPPGQSSQELYRRCTTGYTHGLMTELGGQGTAEMLTCAIVAIRDAELAELEYSVLEGVGGCLGSAGVGIGESRAGCRCKQDGDKAGKSGS